MSICVDMNENYSNFILLSEDAKEKFAEMDDAQLNAVSYLISETIKEQQYKTEKEMRESSQDSEKVQKIT
jgi:hypothetical protein